MNRIKKSCIAGFFLWIALMVLVDSIVVAQNIDPNNLGLQYAYGENIGWINFKPSQGPGVMVTSQSITGYAWGENVGWINLNPTGGGVVNDGAGRLSGYAWGENIGWINFAPTGGGVNIDNQGLFQGAAWGENVGWIHFRSTGGTVPYGVSSSWRGRGPALAITAPTMSEWGMILMAVLLAAYSVYIFHRRKIC